MSSNNQDERSGGLSKRQRRKQEFLKRQKDQPKTPKTSIARFSGMNTAELKGLVISKSSRTSLPQQYDALYKALLTYAGTRPRGGSKAKTSLMKMKTMSKQDFDPPMPSLNEYEITASDGTVTEDQTIKKALFANWTDECSSNNKPFKNYQETMDNLFNIVIGQLGPEIVNSLKGVEGWTDIDEGNDTIKMLEELKLVCYRDDTSKIDPGLDIVMKIQDFVTTEFRDWTKSASEHVAVTKSKSNVLKASGILIMSPEIVKYTLEHVMGGKKTYDDYLRLWPAKDVDDIKLKHEIDDTVRQVIRSRVSIKASGIEKRPGAGPYPGLRNDLDKDYAKPGRSTVVFPDTDAATTALLTKYRSTRQARNDQSPPSEKKPKDKVEDEEPEPDQESMNVMTTDTNEASGTNESEDINVAIAHQLLLQGFEMDTEDDDDDEDFILFHHVSNDKHDNSSKLDKTVNPYSTPLTGDPHNTPSYKTHIVANTTNTKHNTYSMNLDEAYMFAQANGRHLNKWWLLLDSQASVNVICNPEMVSNIRRHPDGRRVEINCNAGKKTLDMIADMNGYGTVWFHKDGIANCLSLALISDMYRITLDTGIDQAFHIHRDNGTTRRFKRVSCNLYISDVSEKKEVMLVTTVKDKKLNYSGLDVRRATAARRFQEIMNYPSTTEFLRMIDNNAIKNCPITRKDVKISEDIYGVNPNIVKGKMVWRQPKHVREDILPVPPEILERYGDVSLSIDVYYINGCAFV